jgi:hypothetical protein
MKGHDRKLWIGLGVMALLSPLGLILPQKMNSGGAWGEWDAETLKQMLGYVPEGLMRMADVWVAPIKGYGMGDAQTALWVKMAFYIVCGLIGLALVAIVMYAISKLVLKNER